MIQRSICGAYLLVKSNQSFLYFLPKMNSFFESILKCQLSILQAHKQEFTFSHTPAAVKLTTSLISQTTTARNLFLHLVSNHNHCSPVQKSCAMADDPNLHTG